MIFVRFSKRCGDASKDAAKSKSYRRAVRIGDTILVQDGEATVAYGYKLKDSTYTIVVHNCENSNEYIAYAKRFIGNSAKWCQINEKRRTYHVRIIDNLKDCDFKIVAS